MVSLVTHAYVTSLLIFAMVSLVTRAYVTSLLICAEIRHSDGGASTRSLLHYCIYFQLCNS